MRRRQVLALGVAALGLPLAGHAQRKSALVGFLGPGSAESHAPALEALLAGLRAQGYTEGVNLTLERRFADAQFGKLKPLAVELAKARPDVIAVAGTQAALVTVSSSPSVPIVAALVADPNEMTVVGNLMVQGAPLTGAMFPLAELNAERIKLLKEIRPEAKTLSMLVNPVNASMAPLAREAEQAAHKIGIELSGFAARDGAEIVRALGAVAKRGDALVVMDDPMFGAHAAEIGAEAAARRIPALGFDARFPQAGALLGFGVDQQALFGRCADYVARILKGARTSELRLQRPTELELVVNTGAARALGLALPDGVLKRASRLIT